MDLIDAIEEMEHAVAPAPAPAHTRAARSSPQPVHARDGEDFVEAQVRFVQQRLRELWRAKHGGEEPPTVPFYWVFSKLLRLVEAYPDGLTEAVVVTELMVLLRQKLAGESLPLGGSGRARMRMRVHDADELSGMLSEREGGALRARVTDYAHIRLCIELEDTTDVALHMYLHQRFRSCVDYLHGHLQLENTSTPSFPFQTKRMISFTNAKLLERKDVDSADTLPNSDRRAKLGLLPTAYLAVELGDKSALDRRLLAESMNLTQVDQLVSAGADPAVIQQLILKAKVLDIGAIRPCQTPLHMHRQVILLGEASSGVTPSGATPSTQRLAQASHAFILWDEQVALSRLLRLGDTLALFHPFVHVCEPHEAEIRHIWSEYSSQQRCAYYFEYGSATVLLRKPPQSSSSSSSSSSLKRSSIGSTAHQRRPEEQERSLARLEDVQAGWTNFSLYAHVRSITVSHGVPLLAAYFYAYYDPKTNQAGAKMNRQHPPALDRAIMSKYYLVVLLHVYMASSCRLLAIEVTGASALAALRLRPGQSVFLDSLVTVDAQEQPLRSFREVGSAPAPCTSPTPSGSQSSAAFAFPTAAYFSASASSVVALCSDWESIFGKQSLFRESSRLTVVNTMPGLLRTALDDSRQTGGPVVSTPALRIAQMSVSAVGWLVPCTKADVQFTCDATCQKGHSTTCTHQVCGRTLELVSRTTQAPPKWQCGFCQEIFFGMDETTQSFGELAVTLEDGSCRDASAVVVLCRADVVESLLGLPAEEYAQLRLTDKRAALESVVGSSFRLLLSRCEARRVAVNPRVADKAASLGQRHEGSVGSQSAVTVDLRADLVQPVDSFAAAHELLAKLKRR